MNARLLGLDALRGLAALMVVLFHLGLPIKGAHLAVDFFFMLSGFVMARTYEERLRTGAMGSGAFLIKRYKRLWGWMALGTSIGFVALYLQYGLSSELLIAYALMVSMLPALNVPSAPYFLNIPLWSIIYELVANIAHALGLARMNTRALGAFALMCFVGLCWTAFTVGFPWGGLAQYHWVSLFKVGASYSMGILIWRLWGDTPPIKVPFAFSLAALPLYCLATYFWHPPIAPLIFVAVIAPLMMFGGMGAMITKQNHAHLATRLGDISFPLYAVHFPVIMLLNEAGGAVIAGVIGLIAWAWLKRDGLRAALSPKPSASA